jgi:16S rRNA (cytosine1402-N4)-methyltransferase
MEKTIHTPVMLEEVLEYLNPSTGQVIVDATFGFGGHSSRIAERLGQTGTLVGIDRDEESLAAAREAMGEVSNRIKFAYGNFSDLDVILKGLNINRIDGILFDLGISSFQLSDAQRGFSFQSDGPLDMRLDRNSYISAYDLVNNLNEEELSHLLRDFGQERWHNRIARLVVQERQRRPITTTGQLSEIVLSAIPVRFRRFHYRIHPATRTFQAVRIAVNRELESLEAAITKAVGLLSPGGRICVISFHSLEDRVVKFAFKKFASEGAIKIITPKPLTPKESEIKDNPRSRSAKFRAAEKI